jgi:hypothetical protein
MIKTPPLLGLMLALVSCNSANPNLSNVVIERNGKVLSVSGEMREPMLKKLETVAWDKIETVRFSSMGGYPDPGLKIAKLLAAKRKPILIHTVCSSACLDVLVISGLVTVAKDTIVLLHNTPLGQATASYRQFPKVSQFLAPMGSRQEHWMRANGIDPKLLLMSYGQLAIMCIFLPKDDPKVADQFLTISRFEVWGPRSDTLSSLGLKLKGNWYQDGNTLRDGLRKTFPKADLGKLNAGFETRAPLPSYQQMEVGLRAMAVKCDEPVAINKSAPPAPVPQPLPQ